MPDYSIRLVLLLLVISLCSCEDSKSPEQDLPASSELVATHSAPLEEIIQNAGLEGSILIFDAQTNTHYSNDFTWAKTGFLPASTYKIPNSVIALETGIVKNSETMFYWDGEPRGMESWEADLTFNQAFKRSCVPCYQQVAREIGVERMRKYLDVFQYGEIDVDSSTLDMFWLQGTSKITQHQQIDFLRRVNAREIPMSDSTFLTLQTLMSIEKTDQYELFGKTGWSIVGDKNNGWFVGFVTKGDHQWYFATNVIPGNDFDMSLFPKIRTQVTREALIALAILPSS